MVHWEIRLANQPAVFVKVDEGRNLAEEWAVFAAQPVRRFRKAPSPWWKVTEDVVLHRDIVAAVVRIPTRKRRDTTEIKGFAV